MRLQTGRICKGANVRGNGNTGAARRSAWQWQREHSGQGARAGATITKAIRRCWRKPGQRGRYAVKVICP